MISSDQENGDLNSVNVVRKKTPVKSSKCSSIQKREFKLRALVNGSQLTIHSRASDDTAKLLCSLNKDSISDIILRDRLIIQFVNGRVKKYQCSDRPPDDQLRAEARILGRFTEEIFFMKDEIKELADAFCLSFADRFESAVDALAGLNNLGYYDHPTNARTLVLHIKSLIKYNIDYYNEKVEDLEKDAEKEADAIKALERKIKRCQRFENKFETDIRPSLVKKASQSESRLAAQKCTKDATVEDITFLYKYCLGNRKEALTSLEQSYSQKMWYQLFESQLLISIIFNRKRIGDIKHFRIFSYKNRTGIEQTMPDVYEKLDPKSKKLAEEYKFTKTVGKKSRVVPMLLHALDEQAYNKLLSLREEAGVTSENPYVFGLPSAGGANRIKLPDPCAIIRNYSIQCGAKNPENLRGTNLRKHIATMCAILNLPERQYEELANFMGHRLDIHKQFYRQSQVVHIVTQVSKLLQMGISTKEELDNEDTTGKVAELVSNNDVTDETNIIDMVITEVRDSNVSNVPDSEKILGVQISFRGLSKDGSTRWLWRNCQM
ncbi:uncharacterized protein LOC131665828 [Phymastichus coffea]|uniref:uncharacterized protein LOC131665828 n=1 Tax=Phymastichus coffea TaxID=108790 RepID=UPI00273BAD8A|nr:uncharacterized protein LOC131665828 [Phymastichus coffea]